MNKQQLEAKTISFKKFSFHELGDLQGSIPREEEKTGIRIVACLRGRKPQFLIITGTD